MFDAKTRKNVLMDFCTSCFTVLEKHKFLSSILPSLNVLRFEFQALVATYIHISTVDSAAASLCTERVYLNVVFTVKSEFCRLVNIR